MSSSAGARSLLAVPDKFRGTASSSEIAAATLAAALGLGWAAAACPLADGGEGTLEAVGGEVRRDVVPGPLGQPVEAEWRLVGDGAATAVIEMSRAAGRALAGAPAPATALAATTAGVGALILAARRAGAERIVVSCGGSATTDGGLGALRELGGPAGLGGAELVVATDVSTLFLDAARVFGPQKGAGPAEVVELERRLAAAATHYRAEYGIDVTTMPGAGAAGGLAGGLAAIGGRIVSGFDLVAELVGLDAAIASADVVVTGEGCLDATSLSGKVVGGVLARAGGRPVLVVAGSVAGVGLPQLAASCGEPPSPVELVELVSRFGAHAAFEHTTQCVTEAVRDYLVGLEGAPPDR